MSRDEVSDVRILAHPLFWPSPVEDKQMRELHIRLAPQVKKD
ncbi:hypothetical protein [Henriciella litoralis]|nr:hypothetical protein [Henriciella litoralis]